MAAPARVPPRRRPAPAWSTGLVVVAVLLAAIAVWAGRSTGPGGDSAAAAEPATPAGGPVVSCSFLDGAVAPAAAIVGRPRSSFLPVLHPDRPRSARSCSSGHEPEVVLVVDDETIPPDQPLPVPDGASAVVATGTRTDVRVHHIRSSSPSTEVDTIRVSDGRHVVSVAFVWSSVDPPTGTGPGSPDIDGAVDAAASILGR